VTCLGQADRFRPQSRADGPLGPSGTSVVPDPTLVYAAWRTNCSATTEQ